MIRPEAKKSWSNPELIVLVRGKPEEAVLGGCKDETSSGNQNSHDGCYSFDDGCEYCESIILS